MSASSLFVRKVIKRPRGCSPNFIEKTAHCNHMSRASTSAGLRPSPSAAKREHAPAGAENAVCTHKFNRPPFQELKDGNAVSYPLLPGSLRGFRNFCKTNFIFRFPPRGGWC